MVGITQYTLKQKPRLIQLFGIPQTGASQRFHQPKRTHVESAFLSRKSINPGLRRIAIDKAIADETSISRILEDGIYCADHPWISGRHEENKWHDKERGIQVLTAVKLCKRFALLVPALSHHFFVDTVPFAHPLCAVGGKSTLVGQPEIGRAHV